MIIAQLVTGPLSVNTLFIPVAERRFVVVDPGGDPDLIIAYLAERLSVPVLFVLTHGHFDHLTALPALAAEFPGVPVAIHGAESQFLGDGAIARHLSFFTALGGASVVRDRPAPLPPATAFLEAGDDLSRAVGSGPETGWKIIHTPGHSPGSVCLHNREEKILIAGDTLFRDGFGRTDGPGGDIGRLEKSLVLLSSLPAETEVIPGHGERTSIGRELGR